MSRVATAPVLIDGIQCGTVTVGPSEEVSPDPLGNGFAFGAAPSPAAFPKYASREYPGRDFSPGHHASPSHGNAPHHRRTLGGQHDHHERHLDPANRTRTAESDKPHKETLQDITQAVHGKAEPTFPNVTRGNGGVDRSSLAKELEGNEPLTRRLAQSVVGEIYYDRATERAKLVQAETPFNRALRRGHSLEKALRTYTGRGSDGYYPQSTFNHRMTEEQYQDFKTNILPKVLAGSNEAGGFTGNASAGVAARQKRAGTPTIDLRGEGGDQYFNEGPFTNPLPRLPAGTSSTGFDAGGKPTGVTRLGAATPRNFPPSVVGKLGLVDPITGTSLGGALGEGRHHEGLDILAPHGSPIYAAGSGTIMSHNPHGSKQGDAFTYIKLDNGMTVAYGHHQLNEALKAGSRVEAGQQIGTSGTANSVPHLHFETWGGKPHQSPLYDPRQVFGWSKGNLPKGGQGARTNPPEPPAKTAETHGTAL